MVLIANVKYARTAKDTYPDLPMATGRIIDDLMYKHWDEWVTEVPHPFIGKFDGDRLTDVADIMADEPYEAPMKPFGGIESFCMESRQQETRLCVAQEDRHGVCPLDQLRPLSLRS